MPQETKSMPDPAPGRATPSQGDAVAAGVPEELRRGLDEAVDYRGDVTVVLKDGRSVEGFVFDRIGGADLDATWIRLVRAADGGRERLRGSDIAELRFSGKDTAAGKNWENWLRRYAEKRFRGEAASIESEIAD